MHVLRFRPIETMPDGWTDPKRTRMPAPFSAPYLDTLRILDKELNALGAHDVILQVAASSRDVRNDGQLRADAKVAHPGVILTIETHKHGQLIYVCDRFDARNVYKHTGDGWKSNHITGWQMNLRAIALGLNALRTVDRYGIAEKGQQYAGYKAIGSGLAMPAAEMTVEQAAIVLMETARAAELDLGDVIGNPGAIADLYRVAAGYTHPDYGGDPEAFRKATQARDVLRADYRRRQNADASKP